jgi:esterase/lipase
VSQEILLAEKAKNNIISVVDKLDIPCYFVMGKYDYMTSVHAAKEYFDVLQAPMKDFVLFDKSAHYPQFEEKELFAEWLNQTWSQLTS